MVRRHPTPDPLNGLHRADGRPLVTRLAVGGHVRVWQDGFFHSSPLALQHRLIRPAHENRAVACVSSPSLDKKRDHRSKCLRQPSGGSSATLPEWRSGFRLNPNAVVDGRRDPLGAAEVAFGGLHRLPSLTPSFFTPLTRRIPAAKSALSNPQSAAS
jgi:hypothetical protein